MIPTPPTPGAADKLTFDDHVAIGKAHFDAHKPAALSRRDDLARAYAGIATALPERKS